MPVSSHDLPPIFYLTSLLTSLGLKDTSSLSTYELPIHFPSTKYGYHKNHIISSLKDYEVKITNVVIPVNVNEEEDEITDEVYEIKRREKGKIIEESRSTPFPTPIRFRGTLLILYYSVRDQVLVYVAEGMIMKGQKTKEEMERMIAKAILQEPRNIQAEISSQILEKPFAVRPRDQDDPHDDAYPEGENSAKRQKTSEYEAYGWSVLSGEVYEEERDNQFSYDQMKIFLKSDIVWESRKKILVSTHPRKTTPLVQSYQRDPEAPALSLINQDLLYLKKGSLGPKKIVLSLHKFPAIIFNDDDIEERTSRWIVARRANECIVSITKPDYKNLNKNDIEDMYLLIVNGKVPDYAETGVLEVLKSYNNDVKYGYIQRELTADEVEYLKLFKEEIEQFEKLVNVSRAKKLEKSHDPLALVAHTGSSSRNTSSYYVTHPTSVVDSEDEYQAITQKFSTPTNNHLRTSSNIRNQAIIQGDRVNIQSRNSVTRNAAEVCRIYEYVSDQLTVVISDSCCITLFFNSTQLALNLSSVILYANAAITSSSSTIKLCDAGVGGTSQEFSHSLGCMMVRPYSQYSWQYVV
ncbi:hypothetical protein Tco_0295205 [Tanacetum coccineum]